MVEARAGKSRERIPACCVAVREMANELLKKLANAGIPELARMPHALDPERGFRVRSEFTFYEYRDVARPASPLRWLADLVLGLVGAGG